MANPFTLHSGGGSGGSNPFTSSGATVAKKKGGGFWGGVKKYTGTDLVGNLAKDVGDTALGVGPGLYTVGKAAYQDVRHPLRNQNLSLDPNPLHTKGKGSNIQRKVINPAIQQYKDYYGHDLGHHLYKHPLQPVLDALTVASAGAGAAAKAGVISADRAAIVTRSPRKAATGKGPAHTEITATEPHVKARAVVAGKVRTKFPEGVPVGGGRRVGGELKHYGKQIQAEATHNALANMSPITRYEHATHRLTADEWTALHVRAMDIHPDDLKTLWKGTPNEKHLTPKATALALHPSKRMAKAEPEAKALSHSGEELYRRKGRLKEETAAARPDLTKRQASEQLGRPVKQITGKPYYFPHTREPQRPVSPLAVTGGGKGVPRPLGSTKQNLGVLALHGKLHLRSDVLGPEFLRRVKFVKYDEIHNALVRGAIRVTRQELEQHHEGKLPAGYEYVRVKAGQKIPATMRGEGEHHVPIEKLIPNPENVGDSQLAKTGFSTTEQEQAYESKGRYYIVPKKTVKAATGEFAKSNDFVRHWVRNPLSVWRSVILGLRVGFLTNNLVGNSVMYAAKTGGEGAIRHLFMAIRETHGDATALKLLRSQATPPKIRADLTREFFPEQVGGTFGRTQSPSTSAAHVAGSKALEAGRAVTGALPRLTSKVAEETPRRALVRHYIQKSPEFKAVYRALPKQTRNFETAARRVLEGKGGSAYQRHISRQVNQALGDYLNLSPFERNVMRNTLPFYSWYRAITTTTYHLAVDTPLRANILGQIGKIGQEQSAAANGEVPSFLQDAIPLGQGAQGTKKVLSTQGLNPYATLEQLQRGTTTDISSLGLNPFVSGPMQYLQRKGAGNISPAALFASPIADLIRNLPPSRLIAPPGPSKLYPTRKGRKPQLSGYLGVPVKEYNPYVAREQARQGR